MNANLNLTCMKRGSSMNIDRREYIAKLTKILRDTMSIDTPVDLNVLVSSLGGKIIYKDGMEENMEALIRKKGESFEIILDQNKNNSRQRFSIAHEIGHLFLHMGFLVNQEKWNKTNDYADSVYYRFGYSTEEYEANEFAACLLMPADEFRKVAKENLNDGVYNLNPIKDYFGVSKDAVINRGRFLGLFGR